MSLTTPTIERARSRAASLMRSSTSPQTTGSEPLRVQVAPVYRPLLQPARYKAAYGGRGSGKSHFFGEKLVSQAFDRPIRFACIREVQNSIRESVRQLLIDKIEKFGLTWFFEVLENEIRGENGSRIIFRGMNHFNADNIKSLEGFDGAWIEEAQTFKERSFRLLRPTLRKPGSEIWLSWNPRAETDAVDQFFRAKEPPKNAVVIEANWNDNPWFPDVLHEEMEHDRATDPEMAEHTWDGGYEIITEQSYYARWLKKIEDKGCFGDFPHDPDLPVDTSWDLGVDDHSSIWFFQVHESGVYVIDFYETQNAGAKDIVETALPEYLQDRAERNAALKLFNREAPFEYRTHHLPHDIKVREWGANAMERTVQLMKHGLPLASIHKGVQANPADRVSAGRGLLEGPIYFNTHNPRVAIGVRRLRGYKRKWNQALLTYEGPLKDGNDHAADAFGEFAINAARNVEEVKKPDAGERFNRMTPQEMARIPLEPPKRTDTVGRRGSF